MEATLDVLTWCVTICLMVGGLVGTMLPMVPGTFIIFLAGGFHILAMGEDRGMSWIGLAILFVLWIASQAVEYVSGAVGAKWFGSTKWGIIGAFAGGLIGLIFGIWGILIGPLVGAFSFEIIFAKKKLKPAGKSTWGTLLGTGAGLVLQVVLGGVMIVWFLVDELWLKW